MPEYRRGLNHPRMRSLFPNFQIRSTRQRNLHAHQNFIFLELGHSYTLNFQIFAPVKHGRGHYAAGLSLHECVISTFSVSSLGLAASSNASAIRSVGKRCEISSASGSRRANTISAYSCCSVIEAL